MKIYKRLFQENNINYDKIVELVNKKFNYINSYKDSIKNSPALVITVPDVEKLKKIYNDLDNIIEEFLKKIKYKILYRTTVKDKNNFKFYFLLEKS